MDEYQVYFKYACIAIGVSYFIIRILRPNLAILSGILASIGAVYYLNRYRKSKISTLNEELEYKLNSIVPRPDYLYIDADLVNFFYNIREFRDYNPLSYDSCLRSVDNLLHLETDAEKNTEMCFYDFDSAKDSMFKALNKLQTLIFRTPLSPVTLDKYQDALSKLHLVLKRHTDNIHGLCKSKKPITKFSQFRDNDGPRPDDTQELEYNPHYNFY